MEIGRMAIRKEECMFCPNCRREYSKDVEVCPECQVKLVRITMPRVEQKTENLDLVGIGKFQDPGYAAAVVAFLAKNGIDVLPVEYRFKRVTRLFVRKQDVLEAKELLKTFTSFTSRESLEGKKSKSKRRMVESLGVGIIIQFVAGIILLVAGIVIALCSRETIIGGGAILIGLLIIITVWLLRQKQRKLRQK
jgi:hypothetical protein